MLSRNVTITVLIASLSLHVQQAEAQSPSQAAAIAAAQLPPTPAASQTPPAPGAWIQAQAPAAVGTESSIAPQAQASAGQTAGPQQVTTQGYPYTAQANAPQSYVLPPPPAAQSTASTNASEGQGQGQGQGQATIIAPPPLIQQAKQLVSPFTPGEIREIHADYNETRKAAVDPMVTVVPKISSVSVDLSPGGALPIARTMVGQITNLVFLDATGAPWPIAAVPLVGSDAFDVKWLDKTPNLSITARTAFDATNLAVFLIGLPTPVVVRIVAGEAESGSKSRVVDYRLDLRVPGRGPNAKATSLGTSRIGMYDDAIQTMLDGIPPTDAKRILIDGERPAQTDVWQLGDSLYVRTPLEMRSAYDQTMSSADGMHVYKLAPTPIVALSQAGQSLSLTLEID